MSDDELDLGEGHRLKFFGWHPDDLPANRQRYGVPLPFVERAGATIYHTNKASGEECSGAVYFDLPVLREWFVGEEFWKVESWDPLSLSPSVLCTVCGDHGFVKNGKWVP